MKIYASGEDYLEAGKIADDATNATLTAYLAGAFGTEGDQEAAIECLKFVKGEKIWLK